MSQVTEPPFITPNIDDTVRSLLGDSYPDDVFVLYMPQRVCHVFIAVDPDDDPQTNCFHWVACFSSQELATRWIGSLVPPRLLGRFFRPEPVQIHQHTLAAACDLVQRVYPDFRGLLIFQSDGQRIRHFVR